MSLKLSRKSSGKGIAAVGGAVSAGTLPRSGSIAPRGNVAKNQRSASSLSIEKKGPPLTKRLGSLIKLPLRIKSQPPIAGEAPASRESVFQPGKSFVFAMSFPQLLGAGAILALLLVWSFFLGILMGRGMENSLPMLAEKFPQSTVVPVETQELSASAEKTPEEAHSADKVIMPEDLRFLNDLSRKSASADVLTSAPLPTDIPQLTAVQRKVSEESVQNATPAFSMQPDRPKIPSETHETPHDNARNETRETRSKQDPAAPQFEYIFQVAASTDLKSVQTLQTKLRKAGLSVSVEHATKNNAPLYRVLVTLRGSQEDSQALRAKLQQLNLRSSFLRSKKNL